MKRFNVSNLLQQFKRRGAERGELVCGRKSFVNSLSWCDITVVTSFSKKGYLEYGERFLESFKQFWPTDVELLILHEGVPKGVERQSPANFHFIDLLEASKELRLLRNSWELLDYNDRGDFVHDKLRFAHKVFALVEAQKVSEREYVVWMDADIFFYQSIDLEWFSQFLPRAGKAEYASYIGRSHMHSECGFMGFNAKHEFHELFWNIFKGIYLSDAINSLKESHDSFIFDVVREIMTANGIQFRNLSDVFHNQAHPFVKCKLGERMDHLKGPRKGSQFSKENDHAKKWLESKQRSATSQE